MTKKKPAPRTAAKPAPKAAAKAAPKTANRRRAAAPRTAADLVWMSPAELDRRCNEAVRLLTQALGLVPWVAALTREERRSSTGKMNVREMPELVALLDIVDAQPNIFGSLAVSDHGKDPAKVETEPTRRGIAVLKALDTVNRALTKLARALSDTRLRVGEPVREVTITARRIAKANAPHSATVSAGLAVVEALRIERLKSAEGKKAKSSTKTAAKTTG